MRKGQTGTGEDFTPLSPMPFLSSLPCFWDTFAHYLSLSLTTTCLYLCIPSLCPCLYFFYTGTGLAFAFSLLPPHLCLSLLSPSPHLLTCLALSYSCTYFAFLFSVSCHLSLPFHFLDGTWFCTHTWNFTLHTTHICHFSLIILLWREGSLHHMPYIYATTLYSLPLPLPIL